MEGYVVCYKCSDDFKLFSYCELLEEAENAGMRYLGTKVAHHGIVVLVTIFEPLQSLYEKDEECL